MEEGEAIGELINGVPSRWVGEMGEIGLKFWKGGPVDVIGKEKIIWFPFVSDYFWYSIPIPKTSGVE